MSWYKVARSEPSLRVWLDDHVPMPADFDVHVKTAREAIDLLQSGVVAFISLDRDLGEPESKNGTGAQVANWIERSAFDGTLDRIDADVHSRNTPDAIQMAIALKNANRFWDEREQNNELV